MLLQTKLTIPPTRNSLVTRDRLIARLDEGWPRQLTLVSAPAGFGKTTLVAHWLSSHQSSAIWFSIDEADNDPARFFAYLITGLQAVDDDIGQRSLGMLQTPQPSVPDAVMTALINEIANLESLRILVLDDYHLITNPVIHQAIVLLLQNMPAYLHLVIITRADPPLPLPRLRVRQQTVEIRAADLRFTTEETAVFLNELGQLNLSAEDVIALTTRTEGWVAGLQLATLSLRHHENPHAFIETFSGSHRYVIDYLTEEVLRQQPAEIRQFLLQTAILDRLSGPLTNAVTEREDSQAILEQLEKANLFVVPLDNNRQWYRYHHLFADVLRSRLRQEQPEKIPALHRRAAVWYEQNGFMDEAVHHALVGED